MNNKQNVKNPVYVIDDHPIISFGLVEMLKDLAPYAQIRQFSKLSDAVRELNPDAPPALIVTDYSLSDVPPGSFVRLFEDFFPRVPVLITDNSMDVMRELSINKLDRFVVFSKLTPFYRLTEILREGLISGGFHTPMPNVSPLQAHPRHVAHSTIGVGGDRKPLTVKQVEVLEYICSGMSNKEIADTMHISAETVKGHVKDILDRLQVKNRMEAAAFYRQARRQNYYASH